MTFYDFNPALYILKICRFFYFGFEISDPKNFSILIIIIIIIIYRRNCLL